MTARLRSVLRAAACALMLLAAARDTEAQLAQRFQHEGQINYVHGVSTMRTSSNAGNPCSIANSTSLTISGIPAGATVVGAYLYWAGSGNSDNTVTFAGQSTGGTGYSDTYSTGGTTFRFFGARADVTNRVSGNGTFTLSGLSVSTGGSYCSSEAVVKGWSLLVVYRHASQPLRRITVFDGLNVIRNTSGSQNLSGFLAAPAQDSRISLLVWEGDATISGGESLTFNGTSLDATGDVFNSSTGHGVDLEAFDVSSLVAPGDRTANVTYVTDNDLMVMQTAVTSLSVVTVDVTPKAGAVSREPGTSYSQAFAVENTSLASDNFNLRATGSGSPSFLQIDSITGPGIIGGTAGDSVRATVPAQTTRSYNVWYTVPSGAAAVNALTLTARSVTYPGVAQATSAGSVNVTRLYVVTDVAVDKTSSASFTVGGTGTYTVELTNVGTAATSGALTVRDTLPAGLTYVGMSGTGWAIGGGGVTPDGRTWGDLVYGASLAPGASVSASITVAVALQAAPSVTNTVWLSGGGDTNTVNNASSVTTPVNAADLAIAIGSPAAFVRDSTGTYTITVRNAGAIASSGMVTVTDTLPAGLTWGSAASVSGSWSIAHAGGVVTATLNAAIAAGDSAQFTISTAVSASAPASLINRAYLANASQYDPANDVAVLVTPVEGVPAIAVFATVSPTGTVQPGQVLTYEVVFTNTGAVPAVDVVVQDDLPADVEFQIGSVTASLPGGITAAVEYFDGDEWTYSPVSGGCGASAGYDGCVRAVRWVLSAALPAAVSGTGWLRARVR